jgi:hypothetical protein
LWPVVADVPIFARMEGADLVITWPRGSFKTWHYRTMSVHDDKPERDVFGTVGLIYYNAGGEWGCDAADHVAFGHHDGGISFAFAEKLRGGQRMPGSPIGLVVTGRSRHNANPSEKDKHRTAIRWFKMPGLEPLEWSEEPPEPLPPPPPPPPGPPGPTSALTDEEIGWVRKLRTSLRTLPT